MKCRGCEEAGDRSRVEVAGHVFFAELPGERCATCGHTRPDPGSLARFELCVAAELAEAGQTSGEAFRFMRRALGLGTAELAAILDVPAATAARWEKNDHVPRSAWERLAAMVLDRREGAEGEGDFELGHPVHRLAALCAPRPLGRLVRVHVS